MAFLLIKRKKTPGLNAADGRMCAGEERKATAIQVKMTEKLHNFQKVCSRKRQMVIYGLTVMDFTEKLEKSRKYPAKSKNRNR